MKYNSIFFSYAWKDRKDADFIDFCLSKCDVLVTRDTRDLDYLENIDSFMNGIKTHDIALLLISDSYLKSKNCMYEALEVLSIENNFDHEKIIPIYSEDCRIFKAKDRLGYLRFWEEQFDNVNSELKELKSPTHTHDILRELEHYSKIRDNIDIFMQRVSEVKGFNVSELRKKECREMINKLELPLKKAKFFHENKYNKNLFVQLSEKLFSSKEDVKDINEFYISLLELWRQSLSKHNFITNFITLSAIVCDNLAKLYSNKTKTKCHVSIKGLVPNVDSSIENWSIVTFARSHNLSNIQESNLKLGANTAFNTIIHNTGQKSFFFSNDLQGEKFYLNENPDWAVFYKSTIVVPIDESQEEKENGTANDSNMRVIYGFLALDSIKPNVFSQEDVDFLKSIVQYLPVPLKMAGEHLR